MRFLGLSRETVLRAWSGIFLRKKGCYLESFGVCASVELLVQYSCTNELIIAYNSLSDGLFKGKRKQAKERETFKCDYPAVPPVTNININTLAVTKTELNYTNTRHRYPWICSLRTKGITAEHLCAVTLLSIPPQPTIIVGPAHCTYLCKDEDPRGARLEACCCTPGPSGCSDDFLRCGANPGAAEMDPKEVVILCGEWETGPAPQTSSGEKYNIPLEISEIIRHPDFDAADSGVDGGSDIAVFKVSETSQAGSSEFDEHGVNPICLPEPSRPAPKEGVHSGWANPPPLHYFRDFGPAFLSFVTDTFKQWHYKLDIEGKCEDPTVTSFGQTLEYPSNTSYPKGLVCAKDVLHELCPNSGDSGSPMMVKSSQGRYYIEGVLSFMKGCDEFSMGAIDEANFVFTSRLENPLAYTKLSCYMSWVTEKFGLSYDGQAAEDEACQRGSGAKESDTICRATPGPDLGAKEHPCIFPFYYKDKLYDSCSLLTTSNFVVPVYRCPTRNITTKYKDTGINLFEDTVELGRGYCYDIQLAIATCNASLPDGGPDCQRVLDPNNDDCPDYLRFPPFSSCKNDCPGGEQYMLQKKKSSFSFSVRSYGIIGGGAVLFAATSLAGQTLLPFLGLGLYL